MNISIIELLLCGGGAGLFVMTVAAGAYLIRRLARNRDPEGRVAR